jgi:hypothetical protein
VFVFTVASLINGRDDLRCWSQGGRCRDSAPRSSRRRARIVTTTFGRSERTKALGVWSAIAAGGARSA